MGTPVGRSSHGTNTSMWLAIVFGIALAVVDAGAASVPAAAPGDTGWSYWASVLVSSVLLLFLAGVVGGALRHRIWSGILACVVASSVAACGDALAVLVALVVTVQLTPHDGRHGALGFGLVITVVVFAALVVAVFLARLVIGAGLGALGAWLGLTIGGHVQRQPANGPIEPPRWD